MVLSAPSSRHTGVRELPEHLNPQGETIMSHLRRRALGVGATAALVAATVVTSAAGATADHPKQHLHPFTSTSTVVSINQGNGAFLTVGAEYGPTGGEIGAFVATGTANGANATDTGTVYTPHGSFKVKETGTLGATDANGLIHSSGSGDCTGEGTGVDQHIQCHFTITGTLDPKTGVGHNATTGMISQS
jgi:hypothetical protein